MLQLIREQYHQKRTTPKTQIYLPDFPEHHDKAIKAGHGGGDFFTLYHFVKAIKTGKQPFFDVYRGVSMSIVGILAYRSALDNSNTLEVPDFRKKSIRKKYKDDHWNPNPAQKKKGDPWPSVLGKITPTKQGIAYSKRNWKNVGFIEKTN